VHNIWQWGITDDDLVEKMQSLGFERVHYENCGRFGTLPNTENHALCGPAGVRVSPCNATWPSLSYA
jgi:hypothetical protein